MKDKIFGILQRVGRSFMLPIAILPVAGLLLGIGSSFTNETMLETYGLMRILGPGTIFAAVFEVMSEAGNVVFANLPILFAMGVAIGMAKKDCILYHACIDQCIDHDKWWYGSNACRGGYFGLWYHIFANGCIWRYSGRPWCGCPA